MFQHSRKRSFAGIILSTSEVIYHSVVREVRKTHGNAIMAIVINIVQMIVMLAVFYVIMQLLGAKGAAVNGDFIIYLLTGVFLFMTHTKTMSAVSGAEGPTSPMMQHTPMNTIVSITAAALGALYIQIISLVSILFIYYVLFTHYVIDQPVGAFMMVLLAWFTGIGVGLIFMALAPWAPDFIKLCQPIYRRVNMIASGKMFLANTLPTFMLMMFDWNPLFHCIDQARGFAFINYYPRNSSIEYPLYVGIALIMIGLMGEYFTRRRASISWGARS